MKVFLFVLISSILLNSCSPLYTLFIQNNTQNPVEIYVELKDWKHNEKVRKVFEKREMYKYKKSDNFSELSFDSLKHYLQTNIISHKKYNFTSDLKYNFTLEPNLSTNIDPNNGLKIYPFESVYYIQNGNKCYVIPEKQNKDCNFKINQNQKNPKRIFHIIEVEN